MDIFCKIRGVLFASAAAACLCACAMTGVSVGTSVKEYETDISSVRAEVIRFSGMENKDFEEILNDDIERSVESDIVAFDSSAQENSGNVRMGNKSVLDIKWEEKYNKNSFISVVEEKYVYNGGAHGNTVRIPRNIDLASGQEIQLSDLFADDGYKDTLNRLIAEEVNDDPEEYSDLWAKPEIKDSHRTDFYIEDGDLVIFYQPYDLSYYARGFVEFKLDLEELSGYMKEEYRRLAEME